MDSSCDTSNWMRMSISGTSEAGDSLSSSHSILATEPTLPTDQQQDDQSFDAVSRQKLSQTGIDPHERMRPAKPPISMFEEDTRSSWSVESTKHTQFKETSLDEDAQSNQNHYLTDAPESTNVENVLKVASPTSASALKETPLSEDSHNSVSNQTPFIENEESGNSISEMDDTQNSTHNVADFKEVINDSQSGVNEINDINGDSQNHVKEGLEFKDDTAKDEDSQMAFDNPAPTTSLLAEDESQSANMLDKPYLAPFKETILDENSMPSMGSPISTFNLQDSTKKNEEHGAFPPENLIEYMWPQEKGEFFILQEQICDYLNIKSFKRKYPDLARRSIEMDERQFLKEKAIVSEVQCDLGLTALRSEEVLELMSRDYPEHYKEYIRVLRDKEQQSISEKQRELAAANADKTKVVDLVKKAVLSAAEYNAHLNQERREERKSCMDLQTFTIHYPVRTSNKPKINTKPGKYPVALLPGQYQDYYKDYTTDELKYLPVNTVVYGPLKELQNVQASSDGSQSDSDDSTGSEGSCCSSSQGTHDDSSSSSEKNEGKTGTLTETGYKPKVKLNAICKMCKKGPEGKSEDLVHCSECDNSAHPSCIELTADVVDVLRTYPWQCMDCKVCSHCTDPNNEDKMLFCDICDRGYHTFCVGLKSLPQGKWVCRRCGSCSICGVPRPSPESVKAQWQYEVVKGVIDVDANRRPKIMCQSCFKKKR